MTKVYHLSQSSEWETPQWLFDNLNKEFNFTLDPCATVENAKCKKFYTIRENGLKQNWSGESVFLNPPYGRNCIDFWIEKCHREMFDSEIYIPPKNIVALLPARTCTVWFHDFIYNKPNIEIRFIRKRLKFVGAKQSAPFPSMIVIWR